VKILAYAMDLKYKKKRRYYWPPYPVNHPMVRDGGHQAASPVLVRKIAIAPYYHPYLIFV
ncbi:MAG: hypothetical protein J7L07_06785, partial [Candidatus Odinarchaeota archaeon]|nr:hypothetical protein [Candidatus Odinarchaeota archaeon]